jgi:hypothetical protein
MSDDNPKRDTPSFSSVPPELRPFMGQRELPAAERRDEAEVEAAFAPIEAMVAEWGREADKRDAERGVGNVSTYVAAVPLPNAERPDAAKPEPKVALALVDVPRELPAGNPNLPTQEMSTRAFAGARPEAAKSAAKGASSGRTIGGNTEKMPVVAVVPGAGKPASPWAKESGTAAVASGVLPSSLGPQATAAHEDDAPGSVTPARSAADGRGRMTGLVIAGAIALAAAALGVRAVTKTPDGGTQAAAATSAPAAPPASATVATQPTASAAATAPPVASTSAPQAPPPAPSGGRHLPGRPAPSDDPYADAAVAPSPVVTAVPTAPPAPPQAPVAPKPTASSAPDGDGLMHHRPHSRSP